MGVVREVNFFDYCVVMADPTIREILSLEPHGPDTFVGTGPSYPWGGLYGGQIVAQAAMAAARTVEPPLALHSLHAYFIRLGNTAEPIRFEVDRLRNGRSFATRSVVVRQAVGAILNLSASFHVPEEATSVQTETMPSVRAPESLATDSWSTLFDRSSLPTAIATGRVGAWVRLKEDLGEEAILQACALAYLSDDLPTEAVFARHPDRPDSVDPYDLFWSASLDHAIWFHRPVVANTWHLHDFSCRGLLQNRGLATGNIFDDQGLHIATVAQEVLIRKRK